MERASNQENARGLHHRRRPRRIQAENQGERDQAPKAVRDAFYPRSHPIAPARLHQPADVDALLWAIAQLPEKPGLIVVDTLARCFVGGDENSARDAGLFVSGVDRIKAATGAAVLILHHLNKSGDARGSTAFAGAFDTIIEAKRENTTVTLRCLKQKDAAEFEPLSLVRRIVELDETDEYGQPLTSLVFEATDAPAIEIPKADQTREQVFQALKNAPEPFTATKWQEASGLSASRFHAHRDALLKAGRITQTGRFYTVTPFTPFESQKEHSNNSLYSSPSLERGVKGVNAGVSGKESDIFEDEHAPEGERPNLYGND